MSSTTDINNMFYDLKMAGSKLSIDARQCYNSVRGLLQKIDELEKEVHKNANDGNRETV